jgi:hypothetical protein
VPKSAWSDPLLVLARPLAKALSCNLTATADGVGLELAVVARVLYFAVGDLPLTNARDLERYDLEDRMVRGGRLLTVELCRGRDLV